MMTSTPSVIALKEKRASLTLEEKAGEPATTAASAPALKLPFAAVRRAASTDEGRAVRARLGPGVPRGG
jgi:hypothetical protein